LNETNKKLLLGRWGPGSGNLSHKRLNLPLFIMSTPKQLKSKSSRFFNRKYKSFRNSRGFEQLYSSIAWRGMVEYVGAFLR